MKFEAKLSHPTCFPHCNRRLNRQCLWGSFTYTCVRGGRVFDPSTNHNLCIASDENVGAKFLIYVGYVVNVHATSDSVVYLSDKEVIESAEIPV